MPCAVKASFKTGLLSLEISQRLRYLFWQKLVFTLQIGDHFFLYLDLASNASLFGPVIQFCLSFKQQYVFSMDNSNETDGKDVYRNTK